MQQYFFDLLNSPSIPTTAPNEFIDSSCLKNNWKVFNFAKAAAEKEEDMDEEDDK
jgi:hypothetical protein